MARAKPGSERDRRESDLLLRTVFAHMAYNSARSEPDRQMAHEQFEEAVRLLYEFVTAANHSGELQHTD